MRRKAKNAAPVVTRDPERTRRRILAAALKEFSAKGFAGARVDAIARRARGNKRMLYHYFGNKEALFTAVLRLKMAERRAWAEALPNNPSERLQFWFDTACKDPEWARLLEWEALQGNAKKITDAQERRATTVEWLRRIRQRQQAGQVTPAFDARHILLAMQSLTLFPAAFPQLVRLATGKSVDDPKLQNEYRKFLKEFALAFMPGRFTRK